MNNVNQLLQQLVNSNSIDLEDFYSVRLNKGDIALQGTMSSDKLLKYKEGFVIETTIVTESGYVQLALTIDNILITFVLT